MELTKLLRPPLIAVLFFPVLCGAGTEEDKPGDLIATALPYCRMMAEPAKYVGSEVAISALLANTPHGGVIYGKECRSWSSLSGAASEEWISPQAKAIFADAYRDNSNARFQVMVIGVLRYTGRYVFEKARIIVALPLAPESHASHE
jgi:hypothetical protein